MQSFRAFFLLVVLGLAGPQTASAQTAFGAQGAEGEPNRMQQWLVPSPATRGARATVSPDRRWAVSACRDCARLDAKRAASRANAARSEERRVGKECRARR